MRLQTVYRRVSYRVPGLAINATKRNVLVLLTYLLVLSLAAGLVAENFAPIVG